jgi:glycosyltransferase involved in cell wall biosynthesis
MDKALNPSKVLMITSYDLTGRYFRDIAHSFSQNGEVLAVMSLAGSKKPDWASTTPCLDLTISNRSSRFTIFRILSAALVIRKFKPDVIQTHLFHASIFGFLVGKLWHIPFVLTRHHIDEHYQSGSFIHRFIDRFLAKHAKHVIVFSRAAKLWLVEVEGVGASQITVINQGFDFNLFDLTMADIATTKRKLNFSQKNLNILCVSRYSKSKGQNYLLYAISEVVKTIPNLTVTFMGPGDKKWLAELTQELKLERYVRLLSQRADVPACIAAADMIIHPSLVDSFSQLVIEAQAAGGLLIASDIAAAREQIVNGVTGLIVPPRDSKAIAHAILYLVSNPELAFSMRATAPIHVREKFAHQRMYEEEIACLRLHIA